MNNFAYFFSHIAAVMLAMIFFTIWSLPMWIFIFCCFLLINVINNVMISYKKYVAETEIDTILTKDLVIGQDYWLDSCKDTSGIYVGNSSFKRTSGIRYVENKNGVIPFSVSYEIKHITLRQNK